MDLKKHQQTLMNIRSKYASLLSRPRQDSAKAKNDRKIQVKQPQPLYQTPIRLLKNQHTDSKKQIQNKNPPNTITSSSFKKEGKKQSSKPQIVNNRLSFSKDKTFDQVVAQRDKQLTQRTERNKQILSQSKQIRQRESRNNSVQINFKSKEINDQKTLHNPLRLILQDKNYIVNEKHKAGIHTNLKGEALYKCVKGSVTDKMKQNLIQNFGSAQEKPAKTGQSDKLNVQKKNKYQLLKQYSIKTPIPAPKESSPSKIKSIFDNTKNIQERIQALLSR